VYKVKIKGSRHGNPLTEREERRIVELTEKGELNQGEIARLFGVLPRAVARVCKKFGIGRWRSLTPTLEVEAVHLLQDGMGRQRVAKKLRLSGTITKELMKKYNIIHREGGSSFSVTKQAVLLEKVRRRDKYCKEIATEEGIDRTTARRYAHLVHGPGRFKPGSRVEPMESAASSEARSRLGYERIMEDLVNQIFAHEVGRKETQAIFIELVRKEAEIWHNGKVPADRAAFLRQLLDAYMPPAPLGNLLTSEEWGEQRRAVAAHLALAIEALAPSAPGWTN